MVGYINMKKLEALKPTDINIQQFFEIDNR